MAITNHERVGKAMESLKGGLAPFVSREFINQHKGQTARVLQQILDAPPQDPKKPFHDMDTAALLKVMWESWNEVYRNTLGRAERTLVAELRDIRNRWAHQGSFSQRRYLPGARLDPAAADGGLFSRGRRDREIEDGNSCACASTSRHGANGARPAARLIEAAAASSLKPWREVVTPHADVASGDFQQAEFAADLWQVHLGEGSDEYREPVEFFRRTFLTESLRRLLVNGIQRLTSRGGDPVVQLQTNFGGGKTHSMLALYHLFSGTPAGDLAGIDAVLAETGATGVPAVRTVVLVGNKISPGNPVKKPDGTVVHTLWGELAHQLGGAEAFARVALDDERATNPGDSLRELFNDYGPCLILIDEWVAYARQLHDAPDLPGGTFETQFTFAQALTEAARAAENCLLLISLPASDTTGSPHAQADDVEVGGIRGREALDRLRTSSAASSRRGVRRARRRASRSCAGGCSSRSRGPTTSSSAMSRRAPSRSSISRSGTSSRPSAAPSTTSGASRLRTRSTRRSSTASTRTGRRW